MKQVYHKFITTKFKVSILLILLLFIQPSLGFAQQCTSGNCKNGKGIFKYSDGSKYIGEFEKNQPHGYGIKYYPDGTQRRGFWKNSVYISDKKIQAEKDSTKIKNIISKNGERLINITNSLLNIVVSLITIGSVILVLVFGKKKKIKQDNLTS